MVCAHMKDTGQRLSEYRCWFPMEHVTEFVKQCLHCIDIKAGEKVLRPLGETVRGTGRAKSTTSTSSMLEQVGRWGTIARMRTGGTESSS